MMRKRYFLSGMMAVVSLALGPILARPSPAAELSGKTVKIGAIYSVSGVCAEWGTAAKIAGEIAVEEINAAGGIGGVPIEVIWYDVGCKAPPAIPVVEKLTKQDKVLVVNGPCQSSVVEVIYPKLNRLKMPMISFCSSKPGLSALSPWGFRNTLTSDKQLDPAVMKWKEKYNINTAVILYNSEDAVSTVEGKKIMPVLFKKYGIKLLKMYTFQTQTIDFAPFMTEIKVLNPDGIGVGSCYEAGAKIAIEARRQGIKAPMLGGACNSSPGLIEIGGAAVEGYYGSTAAWIGGNPDPRMVKFLDKYKKRSPGGKEPPYGGPRSYDNIYIIKKIMEEEGVTNRPADLENDREKIRRGWAKLKGYSGIAGVTSMDKNGDGIGGVMTMAVEGGKFMAK
ncbi:MAG: ABC transporter substrate-binding protein [Deltaproteobacteria bacterium]|nr:ABC transporter substrate-binding protein [Deltaproteobacteria bacterium]